MIAPEVKVARDGKMWGVKVKWPRTGPWKRTLLFPRFVWHGPLGMDDCRWTDRHAADAFANMLRQEIERVKTQ
jgi:hypothetical protein